MIIDSFDYEVKDRVAKITLARPDKLNSLTFEVYSQLEQLTSELRNDDTVNVLIITGRGKGFCSGGDVYEIIGELFKRDMQGLLEFTRMTGAVVQNIRLLDKPVIAAVNGTAAGAGAVIALACDFRILSETSKFAFLFTKVGLTGADMGAAYLLPKVVGLSRATEILMLGDSIDPKTALRIGLAYKVVAADELDDTVNELAQRLANGPTLALSMTKQMINNELNMDLASAIEAEAQAQALLLQGADHKEFYNAFKEKREPKFSGK